MQTDYRVIPAQANPSLPQPIAKSNDRVPQFFSEKTYRQDSLLGFPVKITATYTDKEGKQKTLEFKVKNTVMQILFFNLSWRELLKFRSSCKIGFNAVTEVVLQQRRLSKEEFEEEKQHLPLCNELGLTSFREKLSYVSGPNTPPVLRRTLWLTFFCSHYETFSNLQNGRLLDVTADPTLLLYPFLSHLLTKDMSPSIIEVMQNFDKILLPAYQKAAETGNPEAQVALGFMYQQGRAVPRDLTEAEAWLRKAAQKSRQGLCALGFFLDKNNKPQEALHYLREAAEEESVHAMLLLGEKYRKGNGVLPDISQAIDWFNKAANLKCSEAMNRLSEIYGNGECSIPQDLEKAAHWLSEAAELGDPISQLNLAMSLLSMNKKTEAKEWLKKSARQGESTAQYNLGLICSDDKEYEQARYWYKRAINLGNASAYNNLGWLNANGFGGPVNLQEAVRLYQFAAEAGVAAGQMNLAVLYNQGKGVEYNSRLAIHWYERAAAQNHRGAQSKLVSYYYYSSHQNDKKAFYWANQICNDNSEHGQFANFVLGRLYSSKGNEVPFDLSEAQNKYWLAAHGPILSTSQDASYYLALIYIRHGINERYGKELLMQLAAQGHPQAAEEYENYRFTCTVS